MEDYLEHSIERYRRELAGKKVLLALSGGVDSSVAAVLLQKAIGDDLTCVFVDHGLLRKNEGDFVEKTFRETFGMNLIRIDAEERFLTKLKGVTEPEKKRRNWAKWTFWHRAQSIRMWWKAAKVTQRSSRAITMLGDFLM